MEKCYEIIPSSHLHLHPIHPLLAELLEERLPQVQLFRQIDLALHRVPPMCLLQEGRHDLPVLVDSLKGVPKGREKAGKNKKDLGQFTGNDGENM